MTIKEGYEDMKKIKKMNRDKELKQKINEIIFHSTGSKRTDFYLDICQAELKGRQDMRKELIEEFENYINDNKEWAWESGKVKKSFEALDVHNFKQFLNKLKEKKE